MNTQTAVSEALKNVQAATPANVNTVSEAQQIAELKAKLAAALAPKSAAAAPPVAKSIDLNGAGVAPRPKADTPKVDLLASQVHIANDVLGRPIIVGQSKTLTEKGGKPCKPYNLGIGIRYYHPQTGAITTTWHKADTWRERGSLMVLLSGLVVDAMGDTHLKVTLERLRRRFNVNVTTATPDVQRYETIRSARECSSRRVTAARTSRAW